MSQAHRIDRPDLDDAGAQAEREPAGYGNAGPLNREAGEEAEDPAQLLPVAKLMQVGPVPGADGVKPGVAGRSG